jgi:L-asparaginase II
MSLPAHVPLVIATRNNHVERVHYGSVAVMDADGSLLAYAGDPHVFAFTRSTLKPFQAIAFVHDGGPEHFRFTDAQLALICASHSAEPAHIDAVTDMLAKIGVQESDLRCGVHLPQRYNENNWPAPGSVFDQRHHNCSGKHTGFLGYCTMHGAVLSQYLERDHELQRRIAGVVSNLSGIDETALWFGIDGCSAPNYGMPLARLALMWARLSNGIGINNLGDSTALKRIYAAMLKYPFMVSGTGRCDLDLAQASGGDLVAKAGADGLHAINVCSKGLGIAVKVADGNMSAVYAVSISVLEQLGLTLESQNEALTEWANPRLLNARGTQVGELKSIVKLTWN